MLNKSIMKAVPIAFGLMFLGACATVDNSGVASNDIAATSTVLPAPEPVVPPAAPEPVVSSKSVSTESAKPEAEEDRMICKRTKVPGTNFRKKICGTAEEWGVMTDRSKKALEGIQRTGRVAGTTN